MKNPIVSITIVDYGEMLVELYPEIAPETVRNFLELVKKGFYNNLIFHRIVPDFVIQTGDPTGLGQGFPGHTIKGEFHANGHPNQLKHERGIISMARWSDYNSAGSQFFITLQTTPRLDGEYAGFGKVIKGMAIADTISLSERNYFDMPLIPITIESISIIEYPSKKCC